MIPRIVLGGTFDPVHVGHIESAVAIKEQFGEVEISFVPCLIPAHRPQPIASAEQRVEMLCLAIADIEGFSVDDRELQRGGVSFTFDTLCEFRDELAVNTPLIFVMGSDSYLTLPTWHHWRELTDVAHLLVIARPGVVPDESNELLNWAKNRIDKNLENMAATPFGRIVSLKLKQFDVSATQIRETLGQDAGIDGLIPDEVYRYIIDQHLYLPA